MSLESSREEALERVDEELRPVELERMTGAFDHESSAFGSPAARCARVLDGLHPVAVAVADEHRAGYPPQVLVGEVDVPGPVVSEQGAELRQCSGRSPTVCSSSFR